MLKIPLTCADICYHVSSGSTCSLPAVKHSVRIPVFNNFLNGEMVTQRRTSTTHNVEQAISSIVQPN